MWIGAILRYLLITTALTIVVASFAQDYNTGNWSRVPAISLEYEGPPVVKSLFEDVVGEFFMLSAETTTTTASATLTVKKLGDLFAFSFQIGGEIVGNSWEALPLQEALKRLEKSIEQKYPKKPSEITITLVPKGCQIKLSDSLISTSTTVSWIRRKPLVYQIVTSKGSATDTYIPLDIPSQRLEVRPKFHRIFPNQGVDVIVDEKPIISSTEIVEGFHRLKVMDGTDALFDDIIYISHDVSLSTLLDDLNLQGPSKREVFDIGDDLKILVDNQLLHVPKKTISVIKRSNGLLFLTANGVLDENGTQLFDLPPTNVCTRSGLLFLSDGTVWNYEKGWKKALPNPVIACAQPNDGLVYLLTSAGGLYLLESQRGTLSWIKQTNAYWIGELNNQMVLIDHEGVKTLEGDVLKKLEFPVKSAVSSSSRLYLLLSVGLLESFPEGKRWFVGDGKLFYITGKTFFVPQSHRFLLKIEDLQETYLHLDGDVRFSGIVENTFQVVSGGKLYVLK